MRLRMALLAVLLVLAGLAAGAGAQEAALQIVAHPGVTRLVLDAGEARALALEPVPGGASLRLDRARSIHTPPIPALARERLLAVEPREGGTRLALALAPEVEARLVEAGPGRIVVDLVPAGAARPVERAPAVAEPTSAGPPRPAAEPLRVRSAGPGVAALIFAEYENLTRAARARSEADWLIGMNGSRAFTTKHKELLSVGRVQTPVLALVYDRQKQIEAFSSLKFYEVEAWFDQEGGEQPISYKGNWQGERMTDPEKAADIVKRVSGKPGVVAEYDVKDTREYPMKLYDLTLLQREANAKFAFSAKKTLDVAQALYEQQKVLS